MTSLVVEPPSHLKNMNSSMLDHHPQVGVKINRKMFENQHRDEKKKEKMIATPWKTNHVP